MPWRSIDPLPAARYNLAVASYRNWIYVAGGATDFAMTTAPLSILKSRIEPDGRLGGNSPWTSCAPDMSVAKIAPVLLTYGGNLILLGGRGVGTGDVTTAQDVFVGKIDSDGNIPRWNHLAGALPSPMVNVGAVIKDDYLYLLGGTDVQVALEFEAQTGDFTASETLTGLTSGATANIVSDSDAGLTGTLTIDTVTGVFASGETVVDPLGGTGVLTGTIVKKLSYDAQVVNFSASQTIRGKTSLSSGIRLSETDNGADGILTLGTVSGLFENNELLVVTHATANGALVPVAADSFYLDYDTGTGAFTVGQVVTGAGGATGTITVNATADDITGTLTLTGVVGVFVAGENLTDPITGVAKVAATTVQYKTLAYDAQLYAFAAGQIIWGLTSDATATIQADDDGGLTGTLKVKLITGTFVDDESIAVQYATADGALVQTIPYGSQTGNFTVGDTLTGGTSGAVGTISSVTDGGATGTIYLVRVTGAFEDAEIVTGALGGGALLNADPAFSETALTSSYRARLFPDGGIGPFVLLSTIVPVSGDLRNACEVVGNRLLIQRSGVVYVAHIGPEGIGPFTTYAPGFSKVSHCLLKVLGNKLISIGGSDGSDTVSTCYEATIDSGGAANPVTWHQTQPLPLAPGKRLFGLTRIGDRIFAIGGADDADAVRTEVYSATLDPSGTVGGV